MLSVSSGHSAGYLTGSVGAGREDYYTGAVAEGEPPGTWHGRGAALLGLTGLVDNEVMEAVYGRFANPLDPAFARPRHPRPGRPAGPQTEGVQGHAHGDERADSPLHQRVRHRPGAGAGAVLADRVRARRP